MFTLMPFSRFRGIVSPVPLPVEPDPPPVVTPPPVVDPPTNVTLPAIVGALTVGAVLQVNVGTWTGNPSSFAYIWRSGTTIVASNTDNYTVQQSDVGAQISCEVYCNNAGGVSEHKTAIAGVVTSGLFSLDANLAFAGDSNTDEGYSPTGYARVATMLAGARYFVGATPKAYNRGVAGTGINDVLADVPNIIALNPAAVCIMIGTNDGTTVGTSAWQAKFKQCVDAYKAAGIKVVAIGVPPTGNEYPTPGASKASANAFIKALPNIDAYVDPWQYMVSGDSPDTHFSDSGKAHLGAGVAAALRGLITSNSIYTLPGITNICASEDFSGVGPVTQFSGGNVLTGRLPAGWDFVSFNGDPTNSVTFESTSLDGFPAFKVTIVTGAVKGTTFGIGKNYSTMAVGEVWDGWASVKMTGPQIGVGFAAASTTMWAGYATFTPDLYADTMIWRGRAATCTQAGPAQMGFNLSIGVNKTVTLTVSRPVMFKR